MRSFTGNTANLEGLNTRCRQGGTDPLPDESCSLRSTYKMAKLSLLGLIASEKGGTATSEKDCNTKLFTAKRLNTTLVDWI